METRREYVYGRSRFALVRWRIGHRNRQSVVGVNAELLPQLLRGDAVSQRTPGLADHLRRELFRQAFMGLAKRTGLLRTRGLPSRKPVDNLPGTQASLKRIHPLVMSTATTVIGLLPIFLTHRRGSDVMRPQRRRHWSKPQSASEAIWERKSHSLMVELANVT